MRPGHAIAALAALALLFTMAMDWYGTATGDEARRIERLTDDPSGALGGEIDRRLNEDARYAAEEEERNAWQADGAIDRVILAVLIATVLMALVTAFTRWRGARPSRGFGPTGATALLAALGAILVAYRIVQEPGIDDVTTVKLGAPLALIPLSLIALGAAAALKADDEAAGAEKQEAAEA